MKKKKTIYLNASNEKILPNTWAVIDTTGVSSDKETQVIPANPPILITKIENVQANILVQNMELPAIQQALDSGDSWIKFNDDIDEAPQVLADRDFQVIRRYCIYAQSEELELAEKPIDNSICGAEKEIIELDDFYEGFGSWPLGNSFG